MSRYATLASTASYLPEREITNDTLRARSPAMAQFVDKMEGKTGILRRWYAPDAWATSDLALQAARVALERAGTGVDEVDLIVVGTDSPDQMTPATSTVLQRKLGARRAGTFDVGCACASFPAAVAIASGLIATHPDLRRVLVVGAYMMRKLADPQDPTVFFYGDGAGAAVLVPDSQPGFLTSAFQADGSFAGRWGIFAGGTAEPTTLDAVRAGRTQVRMLERYPPEVNLDGWPQLVRTLASQGSFTLDEIDLLILTQVRKPTIETVMERLGLPMERTHTIMERCGYTGSACIPMALDDALRIGRVGPGALVVMVGSGVGYNQAGVALRLTSDATGETG